MKSLDALISLAVAGGCYLTAWFWLVMAATAIRRRQWGALALLAVGAIGTLALAFRGPLAFPLRPLVYLPLAAGAAGIAFALLLPSEKWDGLKRRREDARQAALHLVLVTGCALFAMPYLWMVLTSLKPDDSIFRNPTALPEVWMWSNYPRAFNFLEVSLGRISTGFGSLFLMNTLQVTALSMAGMILSCSLVAYSFARLRWPGRDVLFMVLLGTMMLPDAVTMIPRFLIFKELGWVDTLLPLWVPSLFAGSAFSVFLLRQFLLTIPSELEDAAKIDGCGYFTIYWRIMMPLIKPALASLAIMHFLATWNDFMGPLIYISSPEKMTGSYALRLFQSAGSGEWALLLAASTMWTIPVVLLFFFAQRAFIEGIAMTGMKN
jgi:multiple sugar transport system permease protein